MTENVNAPASNEPAGGGDSEPQTMTDRSGVRVPLTESQKKLYRAALEAHYRMLPKPKPADGESVEAPDDVAPEDEPQDEEAGDDDEHADAAKDGYELEVPIEVPQQFFPETEANIREAGVLAKELGVPAEEMQGVVDYAVSLAVSDESGVNLSDLDACASVLRNRYGGEADRIIADAQKAVTRLGPKVAEFLDRTQLGNSPAVLAALASYERGDLRMSPEKAQAELDKLTKGEDLRSAYRNANHPGHKAAVDRANLLYAITAKGEAKKDAQPKKAAAPVKTTAKMAEDALDAEIALAIKEPGYRKGDKAVLARVRELYARRYPDNQ